MQQIKHTHTHTLSKHTHPVVVYSCTFHPITACRLDAAQPGRRLTTITCSLTEKEKSLQGDSSLSISSSFLLFILLLLIATCFVFVYFSLFSVSLFFSFLPTTCSPECMNISNLEMSCVFIVTQEKEAKK